MSKEALGWCGIPIALGAAFLLFRISQGLREERPVHSPRTLEGRQPHVAPHHSPCQTTNRPPTPTPRPPDHSPQQHPRHAAASRLAHDRARHGQDTSRPDRPQRTRVLYDAPHFGPLGGNNGRAGPILDSVSLDLSLLGGSPR
jgi:hypothetical protein